MSPFSLLFSEFHLLFYLSGDPAQSQPCFLLLLSRGSNSRRAPPWLTRFSWQDNPNASERRIPEHRAEWAETQKHLSLHTFGECIASLWHNSLVGKWGWSYFYSTSRQLFITSNNNNGAILVCMCTHTHIHPPPEQVLLSHDLSFSHLDFNSAVSHCSHIISEYILISKSICCSFSLILFSGGWEGWGGRWYQTRRGIMKSFIVTFL